jgi:hypothetical protein
MVTVPSSALSIFKLLRSVLQEKNMEMTKKNVAVRIYDSITVTKPEDIRRKFTCVR